eukprot:jgi/Bigna1/92986/estExt_fgenesh1_pm.C_1300007
MTRDVDTKALYSTLHITKDAQPAQIKKAYVKLAREHHPDKGGNAEEFKKIQEAYDVLKDPDKKIHAFHRKVYDSFGKEGLRKASGFMRYWGTTSKKFYKRKGKDLKYSLKVQLSELYNGNMRKLRLNKDRICADCEGKGGNHLLLTTCTGCKGQGSLVVMQGIFPNQYKCQMCGGSGKQFPPDALCKTCQGKGVFKCIKHLEVRIEKGMKNGHMVRFKKEANETPGEVPGDVVVTLDERQNSIFKRDGVHLKMKKSISLMEALGGGFEFTIRHLDNRILKVNSEEGTVYRPGDVKAIMGEGMPVYRDPFTFGNLYIELQVVFPEKIPQEALKILARFFPVPSRIPTPSDAQEVKLVNVDLEAQKRKFKQIEDLKNRSRQAYDDDEQSDTNQNCRTQ